MQASGCAPLARAWRRYRAGAADAEHHRSRYMWPWEATPASLAHGILDDETYDWLEIVRALRATGGQTQVVDEGAIALACDLAAAHTPVRASATGTAGLAGIVAAPPAGSTAVIFSGVER